MRRILQETRNERYTLQQVSRGFLAGERTSRGGVYRVMSCLRELAHGAAAVTFLEGRKTGLGRVGQVTRCGSVWCCPVCAATVSEFRAAEVETAMSLHTHPAVGGTALMVTLTHSHSRHDKLRQLLLGERKALAMMTSWRDFKEIVSDVRRVGTIRAREVTYGQRCGWHPHTHELWLVEAELSDRDIEQLQARLFKLWFQACERAGLPLPNRKAGVKAERALSAAQYLAKWGRDTKWGSGRELSKAHMKTGKIERYTPFDLLRGVGSVRPEQACMLWREFAHATYGARQLTWSRGLKAAMGLGDIDDEQIVEMTLEPHRFITAVSVEDWRRVLGNGAYLQALSCLEEECVARPVDELEAPVSLLSERPMSREEQEAAQADDAISARAELVEVAAKRAKPRRLPRKGDPKLKADTDDAPPEVQRVRRTLAWQTEEALALHKVAVLTMEEPRRLEVEAAVERFIAELPEPPPRKRRRTPQRLVTT